MKIGPFAIAALLYPCSAQGQELIESTIEYSVGTADGKTKFCGVDARLSFMDSTYRKGEGLAAAIFWDYHYRYRPIFSFTRFRGSPLKCKGDALVNACQVA